MPSSNDFVYRINYLSQEWRGYFFKYILAFLTRLHITANIITNFRLVLGLVGVLTYVFFYRYNLAVILLLVAFFLDLFDGALARYQNKFNDRGKFLDIFTDYVLYCFMLFLISIIIFHQKLVYFNLFVTPILFLLATIKKQEFLPSDWLIKPYPRVSYVNAPIFIIFIGYWFFKLKFVWIECAFLFSNTLSVFLIVYYYFYIQYRWKKIKL